METPSSSTRRITRSQSLSASNKISTSMKKEETEMGLSRSKKGKSDRSVLLDITNDSPIIGLAAGSLKTPSSLANNRRRASLTPGGSGEALLRGQVKALLQKVEEEGELLPLSFNHRPLLPFQALLNSPSALVAPTPTNTPLLSSASDGGNAYIKGSTTVVPVAEEQKEDCRMTQAPIDSCEDLVTRALLFDSPGKSVTTDSSTIPISSKTQEEGSCADDWLEEDGASVWSVEVNASSHNDDEEEEEDGNTIDGLCEGLRTMCVEEEEYKGRHTRFIYNEEDQIEGEEEVRGNGDVVSPSIVCLKGLPMPEGKHLRFPEEEEDDDN